jgi:DNA-binding MarR family transcriptional regulator
MDLDAVIHQATRLRIMAALHRNREAPAVALRDALGLTDGNLASHAQRLEAAGYVQTRRVLTTRGFEVRMRITPEGSRAFRAYVEALRVLLLEESPPVRKGQETTAHASTVQRSIQER